jgi:hypothetical protein
MEQQLIPIERSNGVTIYGRLVGNNGRLGQYEVHSDFQYTGRDTYHNLSDAQRYFKYLVDQKKR